MRQHLPQLALAALVMGLGTVSLAGTATAANYSDLSSYNTPYGMSPGQETQAVNPSLRDANGNLTVVNGQFTSSNFSQQSGVQTAGSSLNGSSSSGSIFGGATAIGNSLNVVTTGNNNTVIVNSTQTNNGDQNANVSITGH
jgi:holdfast attachment protein HfaA